MTPLSRNRRFLLAILAVSALGVAAIAVSRANAGTITDIAGARPSVAAERLFWNDWRVALWEVVFNVDDEAEIVGAAGKAHRVTRFKDMRYFVGPFPDMTVTPSPLWGSYVQTLLAGGLAEMDSKSPDGRDCPRTSATRTRENCLSAAT
jgi:hypothetical protein